MTHAYKKVENLDKVCTTLNDLVRINNARIECYDQVTKCGILHDDCSHLFDRIVAESHKFNDELNYKINELDHNPKIGGYASGLIYKAWCDLKVALNGNTQNALLSACQYNEEVTQLAYKTALNVSAEINNDCVTLIERQWLSLKSIFSLLKGYHEVRRYSRSVQTYFN